MTRDAILLYLELEDRGFTLRLDGADLYVLPGARLDEHDRYRIREHKNVLCAVLAHLKANPEDGQE